jgi:hypothetical protein
MSVAAKATEDDNSTPAIAAPLNVLDSPFNMVLTFLMGVFVQGAEVAAPRGTLFCRSETGSRLTQTLNSNAHDRQPGLLLLGGLLLV